MEGIKLGKLAACGTEKFSHTA